MTVKQLRELLEGVSDDLVVMLQHDDVFKVACFADSGEIELGPLCDEAGDELPDQPEEPEKVFALSPCEYVECEVPSGS